MDINTPYITDAKEKELLWEDMRGELKYTLMNDFLSKYSLQKDLYALKGLLAALLELNEDDITDVEILNPIEPSEHIAEKECILDIKLEMNHAEIINIEIQSRYQDFWPERSITYLCRNFDQLKSGGNYIDIKPCVQIGILSKDLFKKDDSRYTGRFYSKYELLNTDTFTSYSSKFSIRVLSLEHIEDVPEEDRTPDSLYFWAKLFTARSWEELKMVADKNPRMESFIGTVRQLTEEEKVAQACEMRRRYKTDIATYEYEIEEARKARDNNKKIAKEAKQEAAEAKQEAAEAKQEAAEAKQEAVEAKQEANRYKTELDDAEARIKELEARLGTIK